VRVRRILAGIASWNVLMGARGRLCLQPTPGNSLAHLLTASLLDNGAKYQLSLFAFVGLLLFLAPISIGIRNGASVVAQRLAFDVTPWRHNVLPSPLGAVGRIILILPKPLGTAMPNFIDDRLFQRDVIDRVADGWLSSKLSDQNLLEPTPTDRTALNRFAAFTTRSEPEFNALPRPQIQSGAAIIRAGFPSLAPMDFVRFCLRYSQDCKIHGNDFRRRTVALTRERWDELVQVNREVNREIVPQPDGVGWVHQDWVLHPAIGACYDYAVTKRHDLLARGWPSAALLLSEVIASGEHHLVLVVRTSRANFVLDNLDPDIRKAEMVNYQWVRIQSKSNPKFWLAAVPERWPTLREHLGTVQTFR
jgi:predicted transglutaminase-like cysteine proteinase